MPSKIFRADQLGSLLRPQHLMEARAAFLAERLDAKSLGDIEDNAVLQAIAAQQRCGIDVFVDGEFRRTGFMTNLADNVEGFEPSVLAGQHWRGDTSGKPSSPNIRLVSGKLRPKSRLCKRDAEFLRQHAPGPFKITLPSPSNFGVMSWQKGISDAAYPTRYDMVADMARIVADEAAQLAREGVPYIQIDSPVYTHWADDSLVAKYQKAGIDLERLLGESIAADNLIFDAARSGGAITGLHLCRGNSMGRWMAEGGYDRLAERLFNEIRCDQWLLEYDSHRAGTFDPLRFMPADKIVVLGLITTKHGTLEQRDDVRRRIDEAARFVPLKRLTLSPQCGFASSGRGNPLTEDEQWKKLALVASIADEVWGET
jgi:5-methyltetrahydropteroyltriglutamate--homocysteine methyltransferase